MLLKRKEQGAYPNLVRELRDTSEFRKLFRMDQETFEALLGKVGPSITHVETNMRESILPGERLAVILRFLATGMLIVIKKPNIWCNCKLVNYNLDVTVHVDQ